MRLGLATSSGLHFLDKRICANWARSNLGPLQRIYYIEIFGPSRASGVVPRLNLRRSSTPNCHYLGGLRVLPLQAVELRLGGLSKQVPLLDSLLVWFCPGYPWGL